MPLPITLSSQSERRTVSDLDALRPDWMLDAIDNGNTYYGLQLGETRLGRQYILSLRRRRLGAVAVKKRVA